MTWSELSSKWGELSSECGASCLWASFLWSELSKGELSLGRVVLFPGLRPLQSKKRDPSRALQLQLLFLFLCVKRLRSSLNIMSLVAALFTCKSFFSSKCHISRPFHKHLNTFVWLLFKN